MSYFYIDKDSSNGMIIRINFNKLPLFYTKGSYTIIMARLLNLSFSDFLRYCRDVHEAKIVGKNTLYPVLYFKKEEKAQNLIKMLNKNVELVLKNKGKC
jgi:hypothetical protein